MIDDDWLEQHRGPHGLTLREAQVIALISQGLSNQAVADTTYLSINSVKTYIRAAYRKIGVTSRSQAVVWGLTHGFADQTLPKDLAPLPADPPEPV